MAKKNTGQLSFFEETVYEYLVLLSPSEAVKEAVDGLKQLLHEQIGLEAYNRNSIAHVSLFKTEALDNARVVKMVKKVAAEQQPFTITLAGHEVLKHGNVSRTLCLKVLDPDPITALVTLLDPPPVAKKAYRQTSILDKPKRAKKTIHPHVTIARNLPVADFDRLTDLTPFDYHDEWTCDRITILRRIAGTTGIFSPVSEVRLG
jgi:2'-5' RNA ligase